MRFMEKVTMTHGTQFWTYLSEASAYRSVENFFVWHSWAGGLKMSWAKVRFSLQCFIDAV